MPIPADYEERVYAGILGKIIGIYLGVPPESWTYERISERFGEINYYVHEELSMPLDCRAGNLAHPFECRADERPTSPKSAIVRVC